MSSPLIHVCGPIAIHSFGLTIAIGLIIFIFLALRDPLRKKIMPPEALYDIMLIGIPLGLLGGRLLYVLCSWDSFDHWTELFRFWDGGVSSLGAIIALLIGMPLYLRARAIPLLPCLDLLALYLPIIHIMVRVGCYLAGCCYGKPTHCWLGIMREDSVSTAGAYIRAHPTQLYSIALLLIIFFVLYVGVRARARASGKAGIIFCAYLMLTSLERFGIDFLRGDQEFVNHDQLAFFSVHQWISLGLFAIGGILMIGIWYKPHHTK